MTPQYSIALGDLYRGLSGWRLWTRFGWQEVKRRYRRTTLGPFWTSASLAIFVISLGFIWANLWNQQPKQYLPYLCAGLVAWTLTASMITESCSMFVSAEGLIKQVRLHYSIILMSLVWRNLIVFFHNLVVYLLIVAWAGVPIGVPQLLVIPGLLLLVLNVMWIGLLAGILCTRFRDVTQLVTSFLQIVLFVTPIFYERAALGPQMQLAAHFNYVYHLLDVVRSPLLGKWPETWSWIFVSVGAVLGWALAIFLFARFRRRLAYWI